MENSKLSPSSLHPVWVVMNTDTLSLPDFYGEVYTTIEKCGALI